jgi:hypothetical protein
VFFGKIKRFVGRLRRKKRLRSKATEKICTDQSGKAKRYESDDHVATVRLGSSVFGGRERIKATVQKE